MAKLRILLDTNIILDVLAHREPLYRNSAGVWAVVESGDVEGWIAAHSITTLFYIIKRQTSQKQAIQAISDLLRVFSVVAIDYSILMQALTLDWPDFEDAVQACAAVQTGLNFLITRDQAGYPDDLIPVVSPQEFLSVLHSM